MYIFCIFVITCLFYSMYGCDSAVVEENGDILKELETSLKNDILKVWYPACLDTVYGGYLSDFTYDWRPEGRQDKMLVTQARHLWTTSKAAQFYDDDEYREMAFHGFRFLEEKMWDDKFGGFYMLRNRQGTALPSENADNKSAYSNAFAIYALSAYFILTSDSSVLKRAQDTFYWLEKYSFDPVHKGYYDNLNRDGSLQIWQKTQKKTNYIAKPNWKDQNSSIHLLEAFTSLYQIWPDRLLRERLMALLELIRDTIVTDRGYLTLFFEPDWTPVSLRDSSQAVREANYYFDHVSFGHDVETAYLMLEASHILGLETDTRTLQIAKKMVDHALENGWDTKNGGFYYEGYYFENDHSITIINEQKEWWVQAEGLNALLLMSKLFHEEKRYYQGFLQQWHYITTYMIDKQYGGWYSQGLDKNPESKKAVKAQVWKANYHNYRALANCIKMLKAEHPLVTKKP